MDNLRNIIKETNASPVSKEWTPAKNISIASIHDRREPKPTSLIVSNGSGPALGKGSAPLFIGLAKTETMLRDFNRLRKAISAHDPADTEKAWERCERWVSCINPTAKEQTCTPDQ